MSQRRYERKITYGFGLMVIVAIVVIIVSMIALRLIVSAKDTLVYQYAQAMVEVEHMRYGLARKVTANRGFLLTGREVPHVVERDQARAEFLEAFARLKSIPLPGGIMAVVERLGPTEEEHHRALRELVEIRKRRGLGTGLVEDFEKILVPKYDTVVTALDELAVVISKAFEDAKRHTQTVTSRVTAVFYIIAVLSVLLVTGLTYLMAGALAASRKMEAAILRANKELEARAVELQASNRELEAFSYSVSHDLRAPLRGIDGFSQALLEEYNGVLDATGQDYLKRVRAATQKMGRLIDDLLSLSRITRVEFRREAVDLSSIARSVIADLAKAEPDRRVQAVIEEGLRTEGDPGLLGALVQNLMSNAWKFTSKTPDATIEFGKAFLGGKAVFFVRDNGAGFDMVYADKLFGAFQRLHKPGEFAGSGIGLAIVRRIVHRHGGSIWAEAQEGKGAIFYFTLSDERSRKAA